MTTLAEQLAAFAQARGGTLRTGPQPPKPHREITPDAIAGIGRTQPVQSPPKADPWLDYTDDYSVWKQGQ